MHDLYQHTPCGNCPYTKKCKKGWLGKERATELTQADSFLCHKTLGPESLRKQCAGHMILLDNKNVFVDTAKTMRISLDISGHDRVFPTTADFIKHHSA